MFAPGRGWGEGEGEVLMVQEEGQGDLFVAMATVYWVLTPLRGPGQVHGTRYSVGSLPAACDVGDLRLPVL